MNSRVSLEGNTAHSRNYVMLDGQHVTKHRVVKSVQYYTVKVIHS